MRRMKRIGSSQVVVQDLRCLRRMYADVCVYESSSSELNGACARRNLSMQLDTVIINVRVYYCGTCWCDAESHLIRLAPEFTAILRNVLLK